MIERFSFAPAISRFTTLANLPITLEIALGLWQFARKANGAPVEQVQISLQQQIVARSLTFHDAIGRRNELGEIAQTTGIIPAAAPEARDGNTEQDSVQIKLRRANAEGIGERFDSRELIDGDGAFRRLLHVLRQ